MVHQRVFFLWILAFSTSLWGQDERFYREIISNMSEVKPKSDQELSHFAAQFTVNGPNYRVDLNGDGIEESIIPQKRDGVDWIEIRDSAQRIVFEHKLLSMGSRSVLYKIKLVNLSKDVRALILFVDEGITAGRRFESTAKLYFISFEKDDFVTMKLFEGPHHFHEREAVRDQYWRRGYTVNVLDLNNDGKREISINFNKIQRVYEYIGLGEWKTY